MGESGDRCPAQSGHAETELRDCDAFVDEIDDVLSRGAGEEDFGDAGLF